MRDVSVGVDAEIDHRAALDGLAPRRHLPRGGDLVSHPRHVRGVGEVAAVERYCVPGTRRSAAWLAGTARIIAGGVALGEIGARHGISRLLLLLRWLLGLRLR